MVTGTVTYYPATRGVRDSIGLYFTHKDHLGSASGAEADSARYYAFGETRLMTGSMFSDVTSEAEPKPELRRLQNWLLLFPGWRHFGAQSNFANSIVSCVHTFWSCQDNQDIIGVEGEIRY
jgi:hypothetical protein